MYPRMPLVKVSEVQSSDLIYHSFFNQTCQALESVVGLKMPQTMTLLRFTLLCIQLLLSSHLISAQTIWVNVQELPSRLEQKYGRDSIEQLLSRRIIEAQHQHTQEQYGYQDTMRIGAFPDATAPGTFCLRLNVTETIEGTKTHLMMHYSFFEKYALIHSMETPLTVDITNIERQLKLLSLFARVVITRSISTYVNTITRNLSQAQIDSVHQAEQDFYQVIVAYQPSAKVPAADRVMIWAMIQNQWNETQAKLRYHFKANFNLYFVHPGASPKVQRQLTRKMHRYVKVIYTLEPASYQGYYSFKAKAEFKNVSNKSLPIESQIIDVGRMKEYPSTTLGSIAGAYLGMKALFGL